MRADDFCVNMSAPTPLPSVPPSEREICTIIDIQEGSHVLLSIDTAYAILSEICADIGTQTARLDGGYIYGETCEAVKTDDIYSYDVLYCATAQDYCDFGDVLLSPDFAVDTDSTLILMKLYEILLLWGNPDWGVEVTITSSMTVNAVGLYLNSLAVNEQLWFAVEDNTGVTRTLQGMGLGVNSQARWYYSIETNGINMDASISYKLIFNFPYALQVSSVYNIETKIRVYSNVQMPFTVDDAFTVDKFIVGKRNSDGVTPGTYISSTEALYIPFISVKFCRDVPTAAPSLTPTDYPTPAPTDVCLTIHIRLVSFQATLYDIPSWFDIFGGTYKFQFILQSNRFVYVHTVIPTITLDYTGSSWRIYDK